MVASGKSRNVPRREPSDVRFTTSLENSLSQMSQNTTPKTVLNTPTLSNFVTKRNSIMTGLTGNLRQNTTISSGILDIVNDSSGDEIPPRKIVVVLSESGTADTLDAIEMEGMELQGAEIILFGVDGNTITVTHDFSPSGTQRPILCPDDADFTLSGDNSIILTYDSIESSWRINGNSGAGSGVIADTVPIAMLKMDDDVTDSIGSNDGTVTGTTTYVDGVMGKAFSFDGSSRITLANESNFDFETTDPFSVSCWMKTSTASIQILVAKMLNSSPFTGWDMYISATGEIFFQIISDATVADEFINAATTASGFNDGEWHHVVGTYDGSESINGVKVYVDGIARPVTASATQDAVSSSMLQNTAVSVGARGAGGFELTGHMDDVRIYDSTVSANEVLNIWLDTLSIGSSGSGSGSSSSSTYTVDRQGNKSGTVTYDIAGATNKLVFTATGDCDITLSNIPTGASDAKDFHIEVIQDGTGGHPITFNDSEVISPPTLSTIAGTTSLLACTADGDGNIRIITLLNAVGSATEVFAWTADHSASTFDLTDLDRLIFDQAAGSALLASDTGITSDAASGMNFNVPTGADYSIDVNGSPIVDIDSTEVGLGGAVNLFLNSNRLILDVDKDTYMEANGDDVVEMTVAGLTRTTWSATDMSMGTGYDILLNGSADLVLDDDDDTWIHSPLDDEIDMVTGGTSRLSITNTAVEVESGVETNLNDLLSLDTAITKPVGSNRHMIYVENLTNDELVINSLDTAKVRIDFDGTEAMSVDPSEVRFMGDSTGHRVDMYFERIEASPADEDIVSQMIYLGDNSIGNPVEWAKISVIQEDVTSGTEDARIEFSVVDGGTLSKMFTVADNKVDVDAAILDMKTNDIDNVGQIIYDSPLSITGSRGGNAALASLLSAFDGDLWADNTTA